MARPLERLADRADAAVHHVRRRDDVGAGLGLDQRLLDQDRDGVVVEHIARVVDDPVMAVRGIGIERDVGEHADLRRRVLDRLDRPADQIVAVERLARILGAQIVAACWGTERCRGCRGRAPPWPWRRAGRPTSATTPGSGAIGSSQSRPSQTNKGQIRSAGAGGSRRASRGSTALDAGAAHAKGGKGSGVIRSGLAPCRLQSDGSARRVERAARLARRRGLPRCIRRRRAAATAIRAFFQPPCR